MKNSITIPFTFLLLLSTFCVYAEPNTEPDIFVLNFSAKTKALLDENISSVEPDDWPKWITGISQSNGTVTDDETWTASLENSGTESAFNLFIDTNQLKTDLALTLAFEANRESDFAIQLYDGSNQILAVDLFGNVPANSIATKTDTYIIPLSHYPSASRIAIRQVSGPLTLYGVLGFPVLSELPSDTEAELSMLELLGGTLSKESRLYKELYNTFQASDSQSTIKRPLQNTEPPKARQGSIVNREGREFIFLGDLSPIDYRASWTPMRINVNSENMPVKLKGKDCTRYIFAHAYSRIIYDIPKRVTSFSAYGVSPSPAWVSRSWKYIIKVDGNTLYTSDVLFLYDQNEVYIEVKFPEGSKVIELIIDSYNGNNSDHAIWAEPYFIRQKL